MDLPSQERQPERISFFIPGGDKSIQLHSPGKKRLSARLGRLEPPAWAGPRARGAEKRGLDLGPPGTRVGLGMNTGDPSGRDMRVKDSVRLGRIPSLSILLPRGRGRPMRCYTIRAPTLYTDPHCRIRKAGSAFEGPPPAWGIFAVLLTGWWDLPLSGPKLEHVYTYNACCPSVGLPYLCVPVSFVHFCWPSRSAGKKKSIRAQQPQPHHS